jgi:hypothetical protein
MNKILCWACDYSQNSGEGKLSILFAKRELKNNCIVFTPKKLTKKKTLLSIANYKYISPLVGVVVCWFFFLKKQKVCYLNYLPLWNFLLFMLLPPKTILGPITGGAIYHKNKQFFVRNFIFPILYKISEILLFFRSKKPYFSTDLLKIYLSKRSISKSKFNYIFYLFSKKIKKKKNIDFLIYYRKHTNKISSFPYKFIQKLISYNFKIQVIGDYLKIPLIINHGYINNAKVNFLLSKTRFSLSSSENPYTVFNMECINNNVIIIADKSQNKIIKYFKKKFIFLNLKKVYFLNDLLIKFKMQEI